MKQTTSDPIRTSLSVKGHKQGESTGSSSGKRTTQAEKPPQKKCTSKQDAIEEAKKLKPISSAQIRGQAQMDGQSRNSKNGQSQRCQAWSGFIAKSTPEANGLPKPHSPR